MTVTGAPDIGVRKINDKGGYLEGWERLGIGIKPVKIQAEGLVSRGTDRLQFDFHSAYGDAPPDMSVLKSFPRIQAVQCDAKYSDSEPLNCLADLKSFRDNVYNRTGVDWSQFSKIQDLHLHDYHGKHHPDYAIFEGLRFLSVAYLPTNYRFLEDLPLGKVECLSIHNSSLQSFRGLEKYGALQEVRIVNCKSFNAKELVDLGSGVRSLTFAFCPKVQSLEFVRYLPALESLTMERLGDIESFEPIRAHPKLKHIEAPPLKGAKISRKLADSIPNLEFVSSSLLDH